MREATTISGHPRQADLNTSPQVVFWEMTRACPLACRHCRAQAQPRPHPQELTTQEGFHLIDQVTSFPQPPILVLTGGDPMLRPDLFDLVEYGVSRGLQVSLAPSATGRLRSRALRRLADIGIGAVSLSLDGSSPEVHDAFRGVRGSWSTTVATLEEALGLGLRVQLNTTVSRYNVLDLTAMASLMEERRVALWTLFFLVPVGRAVHGDVLSAQEHEAVFHWLYHLSREAPFAVKTTLGQPYRRVVLQHLGPEAAPHLPSTNDGKGVCFISHLGEVQPSGFLPLSAGSVPRDNLVDLYQGAPLFRELRDPSLLKGKCGRCSFNTVCGGCRARAYAFTGDYLEAEPCCVFQPPDDR